MIMRLKEIRTADEACCARASAHLAKHRLRAVLAAQRALNAQPERPERPERPEHLLGRLLSEEPRVEERRAP